MKFTIEKAGDEDYPRWIVTCPDGSAFSGSSLREALNWLRSFIDSKGIDK